MKSNNLINNCHVINDFIDEEERELMLEKAERHFRDGEYRTNPAGPHRYVTRLELPPQLDDLVERMANRVVETFGLQGCPQEPVLNKLISRIESGGYVHGHTDKLVDLLAWATSQGKNVQIPDNCEKFRCNITVQMADESVYPLTEDEVVKVGECDAWGFLPSRTLHGTQLITGGTRIIYGFGFIVPAGFNVASLHDDAQWRWQPRLKSNGVAD